MDSDVLLRPGQVVPHFTLITPQGTEIRVSNFRGRKNLVFVFAPSQWPALISELVKREDELAEEDAVVLIITPASPRVGSPSIPKSDTVRVLLDPGALVSRRFGAEHHPAVYITDQYGEIYSAQGLSEGTLLPDADDVLSSLRHINAACPE